MRIRHIISIAILAVLVGVGLISCDLLGTSIETRVNKFVDSLNTDRSQTYTNLVPGSAAYAAANGYPSYWDTPFVSSSEPYSFSFTSSKPYDANDTEGNITNIVNTKLYKFVLEKSGADYFISSLWISNGSGGWIQVF
jgi:hypothetical protein